MLGYYEPIIIIGSCRIVASTTRPSLMSVTRKKNRRALTEQCQMLTLTNWANTIQLKEALPLALRPWRRRADLARVRCSKPRAARRAPFCREVCVAIRRPWGPQPPYGAYQPWLSAEPAAHNVKQSAAMPTQAYRDDTDPQRANRSCCSKPHRRPIPHSRYAWGCARAALG